MATDHIRKLIESWEPAISKAFLEAVQAIRDQVRIGRLVELLKVGDVEGALRELGIEAAAFRAFERQIHVAYESGGIDVTTAISKMRRSNARPLFDVNAPASQAFLTDHTVNLIRDITEDQRNLVRRALGPLTSGLDPMLTGDTPQKLALDLVGRVNRVTGKREGGLIGLTSSQAEWATNYAAEVSGVPDPSALTRKLRDKRFDKTVAKAIRDNEPIPAKTRDAMVNAYRNRALRFRAETIAGNEAHAVLLQAQQDAWDQAISRGVVEYDRVRRFWVTFGDDRVRPEHAAVPGMNPKGVGLKEPFQTPLGPAMNPGWSFEPGCRCRVLVRVRED